MRQRADDDFLNTNEASVFQALTAFIERANREDQTAPVDAVALADIVAKRKALAGGMQSNTMLKIRLSPKPNYVYDDLVRKYIDRQRGTLVDVPPGHHAFLTRKIEARKNHRLFGLAIPEMTDYPDLRGLNCVMSLDADALLGTETEHENGFSIWADRDEMAEGRLEAGRVIWHTNV